MDQTEKNNDDYRFHLFVRPKDAHAESWDGARSGVDAAKEVFNADEVRALLFSRPSNPRPPQALQFCC